MSSKQGHEALDSYTDNINVKISERYKPPPRINLPTTYSQRLTLNKHIQDNIPNYDFTFEKSVLEKMKEWKHIRALASQERQSKLDKARDLQKKKELECIEQEQVEEVELKTVNETITDTDNFISAPAAVPFNNQNFKYSTNNNILIPTQVSSNYSNILTPIPLHNYGTQHYCARKDDKSPFNLSDFENDTSSPFDNMELKSINDMEELAQVLNSEEKKYKVTAPLYSNYNIVQPSNSTSQPQPTYISYLGNQYSYNIPTTVSYNAQPACTDYSQTNGYYLPTELMQQHNQPIQLSYYSKPNTVNYNYSTSVETPSVANHKSVPDIVKALESELENTFIANTNSASENYSNPYLDGSVSSQTDPPKSTGAVYPRPKIKTEELNDPFKLLSKNEQDLCRSISSMGFPLSRVARTCEIFGNDQKKVVEHLLALSDLLDLGFSEVDVSSALVQCNNDRDKALDKLIS